MEGVMETEAVEALGKALGTAGITMYGDGTEWHPQAVAKAAGYILADLRADPAAARAVRDAIDPDGLRTAADRLCNAYADKSAATGLARSGCASFEDADRADDVFLCALQDTRTAIDGRERPHLHIEGTPDAD